MSDAHGGGPDPKARLAQAVAAQLRETLGRGPERARVFFGDEHVFVVLEGALTQLEDTLLGSGDQQLVQTVRARLDELDGERMARAAEEILDRQVLDVGSRLLPGSRRVVQVFVLGDPRP